MENKKESFVHSDVEAQWCSQGDLLAVAGMERHLPSDTACAAIMRNALVKFYNVQGEHIYTLETPAQVHKWLIRDNTRLLIPIDYDIIEQCL